MDGIEEMRVRPLAVPQRTLADIAEFSGVLPPADAASVPIRGIALNTGDLEPGDLYAALPGERTHGATYAAVAEQAGAVALLTDSTGAELIRDLAIGLPSIVIEDPRARVADLSAWFYDRPSNSLVTLGITGTQGKTTSTYLAEAALGERKSAVVGTIGTRINGIMAASALTTPEAPQLQALFAVMREEGIEACAMEVSSHAMVQGRVAGFGFDAAIFLNLGRDHLDFHHTLEEYFLAKAELFSPRHAKRAVINVDDPHGRRLIGLTELPVTTFSTEGNAADWRAVNIRPHRLGTDLEVYGPQAAVYQLTVPLAGAFNVSNALSVVAALATLGYDPGELCAGIAACRGVPGRMQQVEAGQDFTAVIDYAHKPDAVTAVLSALRPVTAGRLIVVLGAGGDRDHGKRPLMARAAVEHADLLIVTDDNPRSEDPAAIRSELIAGAAHGPGASIEVPGRRAAIAEAVSMARLGDTVVIAGKGHERGQEIAGVVHPFDDHEVLVECINTEKEVAP